MNCTDSMHAFIIWLFLVSETNRLVNFVWYMDVVRASCDCFNTCRTEVCTWNWDRTKHIDWRMVNIAATYLSISIQTFVQIGNTREQAPPSKTRTKIIIHNSSISSGIRIEEGYQWSELHCHQLRRRSIIIRLLQHLCEKKSHRPITGGEGRISQEKRFQ